MARKSIEQRLAELETKKKTLKARLTKQERTRDTRRKVLVGALVLLRLEHAIDPEFTRRLTDWQRRDL
ncbi:MAG: mobilization protein, partial [Nisaea sp.]|uniref:mobilization protein n=1 Tax=Nisaea sp. TaxID=2024842 RepID=UPI003298617E